VLDYQKVLEVTTKFLSSVRDITSRAITEVYVGKSVE